MWLELAGGEAWGIRVVRKAAVEVTAEPRSWGLPWVHGPPKDGSPQVGRLGLERATPPSSRTSDGSSAPPSAVNVGSGTCGSIAVQIPDVLLSPHGVTGRLAFMCVTAPVRRGDHTCCQKHHWCL